MRQLNKVSTLEVVALCRFVSEAEKRHTMSEFAASKLDVHYRLRMAVVIAGVIFWLEPKFAIKKPTMREHRISR